MLLFLYVILLINRPVVKETRKVVEPSVLAILVDDSLSMSVRDVDPSGAPSTRPAATIVSAGTQPSAPDPDSPTRLEAVIHLLAGPDQAVIRKLAEVHTIHFYSFDRDAHEFASTAPGGDRLPGGKGKGDAKGDAKGEGKDGKEGSATADGKAAGEPNAPADGAPSGGITPALVKSIRGLKPEGQSTRVVQSLTTVLDSLQGQRLAGVVVITDARETPEPTPQAVIDRLHRYNVPIYPVAVGSEKSPQNINLEEVNIQPSVFKDDIVTATLKVVATGYEPKHKVTLRLRDRKTGRPLARRLENKLTPGQPAKEVPAVANVQLDDGQEVTKVLEFTAPNVGPLEVEAVADFQEGELRKDDNTLTPTVDVVDATINVLYVDGYPRWEYRYIKNEMIRDPTVDISCVLVSSRATQKEIDEGRAFSQEGDDALPYLLKEPEPQNPKRTRQRTAEILAKDPKATHGSVFPGRVQSIPQTMEELLKYDVVLFGDVDARQFSDRELQMISDFVEKKGGGFGMVAGPQYSPIAYRNSPIEAVLPVNISHVTPEDPGREYKDGWRPVVTNEGKTGEAATIFQFINDPEHPEENDRYLRGVARDPATGKDVEGGWPPVFWFCQGVLPKGTSLVYAEHPFATGPNGRKTPVLVLGRYGAGRTMFSGIDDSWRWRFYTGEGVFDTYWVQQLRYLARSKKLGQRKMTFETNKGIEGKYEQGEDVTVRLKVLDPTVLQQMPPQIRADVVDKDNKDRPLPPVTLLRQETPPDLYSATFSAGSTGSFVVTVRPGGGQAPMEARYTVNVPQRELSRPALDPDLLAKLAPSAQIIRLQDAREKLADPDLIKSAARTSLVTPPGVPLWNKWRALAIFVLLLTAEWVLRKVFGML